MDTPPFYMTIFKKYENYKKNMYLRSSLPPGGRPDLRINQYAKYATYTEYAKYGFSVLHLASASPFGAPLPRWTCLDAAQQ